MVFVTRENVLNTKNSVFRVGPIIVRRFHVPSDKTYFIVVAEIENINHGGYSTKEAKS
jgi:hypothetical protein